MSSLALSSSRFGLRHQVKQLIQDRVGIRQVFLRTIGDENTRRCQKCNYLFQLEEAVREDVDGKKVLGCPVCEADPAAFQVELGFTHTDSFLAEDETKAYQFMQLAANFISRMIVAAPMVGLAEAPNLAPTVQAQTQPTDKKWRYIAVAIIAVAMIAFSLVGASATVTTSSPIVNATTGMFVPSIQQVVPGKDAATLAILAVVVAAAILVGPELLQQIPGLKPESPQVQSWSDWVQLKVGMGEDKKTSEKGCMRKYRGAIRVLRRLRDPNFREEIRLVFRPEFDAAFSEVMNKFDEAFRIMLGQLDMGIVEVSRPSARAPMQRRGGAREEEAS